MRSFTSYVNKYLNLMASATPYASSETVTGLPIGSGVVPGTFLEYTDGQVSPVSNPNATPLRSGTYMWVQLDSGASAPSVGQAMFWKQGTLGHVVTNVASGNSPDFAGVVIDPTMSTTLPYAYIQTEGLATVLYDTTPPTAFGDTIGVTSGAATFTKQGTSTANANALTVGVALGVTTATGLGPIRITRTQGRY